MSSSLNISRAQLLTFINERLMARIAHLQERMSWRERSTEPTDPTILGSNVTSLDSEDVTIASTEPSSDQICDGSVSLPIPITNFRITTPQSRGRRHRSHHRHRCHTSNNGYLRIRLKNRERNYLAAFLSIVVVAVIASALAQPKWFSIYNDLCVSNLYIKSHPTNGKDTNASNYEVVHVAAAEMQQASYMGSYTYGPVITVNPTIVYGLSSDFKGCATTRILTFKRVIVALCMTTILFNLVQFFMDAMGTKNRLLNSMRAYAWGSTMSILLCIVIIGLCYFVTILYERVQLHHLLAKLHRVHESGNSSEYRLPRPNLDSVHDFDYLAYHQVEVKFEVSYYLITLAGFISIFAAAANLFRKPRFVVVERSHGLGLPISPTPATYMSADENSLLSSDMLSSDMSNAYFVAAAPHQQHNHSQQHYPMNNWMFNTTGWMFNGNSGGGAAAALPTVRTNGSNIASSYAGPMSQRCPPPPPYSP